jgi:hypothetical protein
MFVIPHKAGQRAVASKLSKNLNRFINDFEDD